MGKTIIISGHISGEAQENKRKFLERLDECLKARGFNLLLVNLGRIKPDTRCEYFMPPGSDYKPFSFHGKDFIHLEDLAPEMVKAAAVEAEIFGISMVAASVKVVNFASHLKDLLLKTEPCLCIMWHEFNGRHYALRYVCQKLGIPYLYIEYGVLPGTINIDEEGQMAESWVSRHYEEFRSLETTEEDLDLADRYLDFIRETKQTRKPQNSEFSIESIVKRAREQGRKILFYAGQNDWGSGILPPWITNAKIHSPIYDGTMDSLTHLLEIAQRNNWHILFKPHPLVEDRQKDPDILSHDCIDIVLGANIFQCFEESDAVLTILSGVSYLALAHRKPVVLLGRNHLYKKGCAYEVFWKEDVESVIKKALEEGGTDRHQRLWKKHVAQLLRYYLYAFDEASAQIIGKDVDETANYIIRYAQREYDLGKIPSGANGEKIMKNMLPPIYKPLRLKIKYALHSNFFPFKLLRKVEKVVLALFKKIIRIRNS